MNPDNAKHEGYTFTSKNETFFIGLFGINDPNHPDIVQPYLLVKDGPAWVEIDKTDIIWKDLQRDIIPSDMMKFILADFNKTISKRGGGPMTWIDELAAFFLLLEVKNNQLVLKEA